MDIADVKRQARTAASKRRAAAHAELKDEAGLALAARGLPQGLHLGTGAVSRNPTMLLFSSRIVAG